MRRRTHARVGHRMASSDRKPKWPRASHALCSGESTSRRNAALGAATVYSADGVAIEQLGQEALMYKVIQNMFLIGAAALTVGSCASLQSPQATPGMTFFVTSV